MIVGDIVAAFHPVDHRPILSDWAQIGKDGCVKLLEANVSCLESDLAPWPVDFTRDVRPVPCHSYNDYLRRLPLYSALSAGCTSVEADVWLFEDQLYVGHYKRSLAKNRTLSSLYINPIKDILDRQNSASDSAFDADYTSGVFSSSRDQPLTLLIDFKNSPQETCAKVVKELEPLRSKGYLSFWSGKRFEQRPITVVGTRDTPFENVISDDLNAHRDIFYDAPLDELWVNPEESANPIVEDSGEGINFSPRNSSYASVSFGKSIGRMWKHTLTAKQLQLIRGQIRGAHARGLKVRYWSLPNWPISLRNEVWDVLTCEGVDVLNVDDLSAATASSWR